MRSLLALGVLCAYSLLHGAIYHVAVDGNDANRGTQDEPFASIARAQRAVRGYLRKHQGENVVVHIADGTYRLERPLVFGPEDGGNDTVAVTYRAVDGARPVLSGGLLVTGWTEQPDGTWRTVLPAARDTEWYPRQLFVNGRRAQRARWPNADASPPYRRVRAASLADDRSLYTITLDADAVMPWEAMGDIEIVVCGNWEITRKKLLSADPATGVLTLAPPHSGSHPAIRPKAGRYYFLENAREFLDQAGEWYLDRRSGRLTYWPREGEELSVMRAVVPRLTRLLEIRGMAESPVRNLHVEGLRFAHADWALPPYGFSGTQASFHTFPAEGQSGWDWFPWRGTEPALLWEFCHGCSLRESALVGLGGSGLHLRKGCSRNTIEGNLVEDIGANGIMVGENLTGFPWGRKALPEDELPVANRITSNLVRRCGLDDYGAVGIWVSCTDSTTIAHNLIYDLPYSGISVGWRWDDTPTANRANRVEFNHVHSVLRKLCDGGCLYTLGRQPDTVIRGNWFHGAARSETAQGAPNNGIFFDQGSSGFRVEGNLVYGTSGAPIRFNRCKREWHTWKGNHFGIPAAAPGKHGPALSCDGTSGGIEIPHDSALDPPRLTVEAWVYFDDIVTHGDTRRWVVNKNKNEWADGHWALVVRRSRVGAYLNIGGGQQNTIELWSDDEVLTLQRWHHIAFSYDGRELRVYRDGDCVATTGVNRGRTPGNLPLAIGRRQDAYSYFRGLIDEVVLYSEALTPAQIAERVSAGGVPPSTDWPVAGSWSFDDFSDSLAVVDAARERTGPREPHRSRFAPLLVDSVTGQD